MPADNFPESGSLARDIARIGLFTAAVAIIVFTAGPAGVFILGPSTVAKLSAAQLAFQTKIASTSVGAAVTGLAKTFPMTARAISLGTAATGRYIIGEMTTFAVGGFTGTVIMTTTVRLHWSNDSTQSQDLIPSCCGCAGASSPFRTAIHRRRWPTYDMSGTLIVHVYNGGFLRSASKLICRPWLASALP